MWEAIVGICLALAGIGAVITVFVLWYQDRNAFKAFQADVTKKLGESEIKHSKTLQTMDAEWTKQRQESAASYNEWKGALQNTSAITGDFLTSAATDLDAQYALLSNMNDQLTAIEGKAKPGVQGETGPKGPQGLAGPRGPVGTKGDRGINGPMGPKGEDGKVGETGLTGPKGLTGPAGVPGQVGATGDKGFTGLQGPAAAHSI